MPPKSRARCQVCKEKESRYNCSGNGCLVEYCSVPCYKEHKETCNSSLRKAETDDLPQPQQHHLSCDDAHTGDDIDDTTKEDPLRPLTSLKWPFVPEETAYPDPLKRDDPKPLQTAQYEAIATSPAVRTALEAHPKLKEVLRTIDRLQGSAREEALQASLGISRSDVRWDEDGGRSSGRRGEIVSEGEVREAMRGLAEAIEAAVRGSREGILGLDWC